MTRRAWGIRRVVSWARVCAMVAAVPGGLGAQESGSVLGRVRTADSGTPLAGATIELVGAPGRTLSGEDGRFILVGVPPGEQVIRVSALGFRGLTVEGILVRVGRPTRVDPELEPAALEVEGVTAEVDRIRLIEPEISATHEVVLGREVRALPVDDVAEVVELAPGVSEGHFRGGRIGQEVYVLDGLELKNQLDASSTGSGFELPPSSLEELEVVTGGMGAQYGSALSGVVRYVTRRGDRERWRGGGSFRTDSWTPDDLYRGFSSLALTAGGPLGSGPRPGTLFADVLLQGMHDADPRGQGLTCLEPGDGDDQLDALIRQVADDPVTERLYCPYTAAALPYQRGDKALAFLRWDHPLATEWSLTASVLGNRHQQELYTPELKYNPTGQLGQRSRGLLGTLSVDWIRQSSGAGTHVVARLSAMRLDRQLGALDPGSVRDRSTVLGFGLADFRFLGEDFVRSPIEEQLQSGLAVPGYEAPGGSTGSPFGPAGEGIFATEGTTDLAVWSRSEFLAGDLVGEYATAPGHRLSAGVSGKLWRIESYERVLSHLPGSSPNYTEFFPATWSGFAEVNLAASDEINVLIGVRGEAFRSGLAFREDGSDFLAPTVDTEWKTSLLPRVAVTGPIPGTDGRTAFRFNYGLVSQPPDFQFFLDTSVGDSLRSDIRRQGNPDLSFERGTAYEVGLSHLFAPAVAATVVGFRKELTNLVSGNLQVGGLPSNQFTTGDFGTVQGVEMSVRGQWQAVRARLAYSLQKATGVVSSALVDEPEVDPEERTEFPLAFDRRHSASGALLLGRASGASEPAWSVSAVAFLNSGYPVVRSEDASGDSLTAVGSPRLPWTFRADLRGAWRFEGLPGCGSCGWSVLGEVRNLFGQDNVIAVRRDSRSVAPPAGVVTGLARDVTLAEAIPRESPRYSAQIDLDGDGRITPAEFERARLAAALDRYDPSLFYGSAVQVRLGIEVLF